MNKKQAEFLQSYTCHILDSYSNVDDVLSEHGINKKCTNKIKKAFDLIFEVNEICVEITNKKNKK